MVGHESSNDMPTVHLICGLPCSGKTTYAVGLKADANCVLFSLDRWLITLFGRYSLTSVGHEEHTRRVLACRELIWEAASQFLKRGVDVILDDGFFLRDNRVRVVEQSRALGAEAKIHFLKTPTAVLQTRLAERNANLPQYNFLIDPKTLTGFLGLFEAPTADEGASVVVVQSFERPGSTDVRVGSDTAD
jgi:predicted kinase